MIKLILIQLTIVKLIMIKWSMVRLTKRLNLLVNLAMFNFVMLVYALLV
jgi:hypothetical protein